MRSATRLKVFVLSICLFLVSGASFAYPARVVAIIDGDTVKVLTDTNEMIKVRLAEIDAPEKGQPWGTRSKQALAQMIFEKTVEVASQGKDRYGRTIGILWLDGTNINLEMVRNGHAWAYRRYVKDPATLEAEALAVQERLGLWALSVSQRIPPWEWRQTRKLRRPLSATQKMFSIKTAIRLLQSPLLIENA